MTTEPATSITAADSAAALSIYGEDSIADGYSQAIGVDKIKLARKVFNKQGLDESGTPFRKDCFYDTATQVQSPTLQVVLIYVHGWRAWSEYDDVEKKTNLICVTNDCITGTITHTDGQAEQRRCRGCKDYEWGRTAKGKPFRNCSDRYTVLGVDLATSEPFLMGFKKTSEKALTEYLAKYHTNKRKLSSGKLANKPIDWFTINMKLTVDKSGLFAVPVLTPHMTSRVDPASGAKVAEPTLNDPELVVRCRETLDALKATITHVADDEDTSFDTGDFAA
jgi:hypothetical protein